MAQNGWEDLPSISVTVNNPSVGTNGAAAPTSSNEIGFIDGSGNLQGVSAANPLPVDIHLDTVVVSENLTEVNSQPVDVGIGAAGVGTQRVAVSSDSSMSISGNVTVVQPTGSNLHVQIDAGSATIGKVDQGAGGASAWKVDGSAVTQPVSAVALPLPSGAATSANQTNKAQYTHITDGTNDALVSSGGGLIVSGLTATGIAPVNNPVSVSGVDGGGLKRALLTDTTGAQVVVGEGVAGTPAGGVVSVQGVSGGQALPVTTPSNVAPATQNVTIIDSGSTTTAQANGQNAITGSPTANSAASFSVSSQESVEVQVTGTWTGTLSSEVSFDSGTTWYTRGLKQTGSPYLASTFTANFQGGASAAGITNYRIRATAAMTGTAIVKAIFSMNQASIVVSNPLTLRDSTTQTIANTIKAASTAAVATDPALVVAISPNNAVVVTGSGGAALALDASVTGLQVSQGSTTSGQKGALDMGAVTTAAPSYTTGQSSPLSLDTVGNLRVRDASMQGAAGSGGVGGTAAANSALVGAIYNQSGGSGISGISPGSGNQAALQSDQYGSINIDMPDIILSGAAAQTVIGTNIINSVSGSATSTDVANYKSGSVQVVSTGTGGTFIAECSMDNVNFVTMPVFNQGATTGAIISAAVTASSSQIIYTFPIQARYIRFRIATTITGGSIQAFTRISQAAWTPTSFQVAQSTASSLLTTTSLSAGGIIAATANTLVADVASGAIVVTTNSATITPGNAPNYQVNIAVTAGTFSSNTYSFAIQESSDSATNWYTVYTFPNILSTGTYNSPILPQTGNRIRYVQTVGGGSPTITRAINRIQINGSSALPYKNLIDLSINPTSTNSVTASLACEGNNTYSAIVNQGAGGSAVNFAMDGSDDNSNWVSAIATCTGVVGGATPVAMYYSGVNYRFIRVRVVTGVAATTISYVSLSGSMGAHDANPVVTGTVTANPVVGALTNRSGSTSGTPSTSTTLMSSNASRKYLAIQNLDGTTAIFINFTSAADATNSFQLAAGQAYVMEGSFVSTEAITVFSTGTSIKYAAKEG